MQADQSKKRIIAIVGRPNVGKSAIFNRLAGRRIAIVHEESGVTRDRLMHEVNWKNDRFDLVDTGGLCTMDDGAAADEIAAGIRKQIDAALADAAAAIFVVDIVAGVVPMDQEVARLLRASGCFSVIAANKADSAARDAGCAEFERFGFPVFAVSALHDRGFDPLMDAVVRALPDVDMGEKIEPLKVAVVGRPNVGKSSFINRLLRSDRLIVSTVPGTTRDSVEIPFAVGTGPAARHYLLMDTAGMRRRGRIHSSVEKFSIFRAEKSVRRAHVVVLMLDAVEGPLDQDKKIGSFIMECGKGCAVVVNKWDLAKEAAAPEYAAALRKEMSFMAHCPIVFVSSKSGHNIRRAVETIDHVASQVRIALPTGVLNRTILDACERVQPPFVQGKRLKIFYAAQVGCEPIRVRLFVNDPRRMTDSYEHYMVRILRERFGLEGAPVILQCRARPRGEAGGNGRSTR